MNNQQKERAMIEAGIPHGIPGQFNRLCPDLLSHCTGYGKHDRIVVGYCAVNRTLTAREDHGTGPRPATRREVEQMIRREWPKEARGMKFKYADTSEVVNPVLGARSTWHVYRTQR